MNKKFILGVVLCFILMLAVVLGAGESTGNTNNTTSSNSTIVSNSTNSTSGNTTNTTSTNSTRRNICEDKSSVKDRIKCRFENKEMIRKYAFGIVEEACRDDRYKERCQALYKRSAICYNMDNVAERKKCFLKESGISFNAQGAFRAAPDDAKRNYVVLLLYELQERIEKMQENEKIATDQATSLIEKIVEIKKMILAKEPRSEIVVKMNEFKQEYRTVLAGINND